MDELRILIKDVEDKWLKILFNNCKDEFKKVKLPSHDHLHHQRVWNIAKELFRELKKNNIKITKNDLEKTIIAVFFHDIGMIKTVEKTHGTISKEMCETFFRENNLEKIHGFNEVLNAIQKHDDKEYKEMMYHDKLQKNVLAVLCVSDDLDAFGAVGAFRYLEIYLLRNFSINELTIIVLENIERRYKNFHNLYSNLDTFTKKEKARYNFIETFYLDLKKELNNSKYSREILVGAIGVVNLLIINIIEEDTTVLDISDIILKQSDDDYVLKFFKQFNEELRN